MFLSRINKLMMCVAALAIVSGCAILDKKDSDKESNWFVRQFEKDGGKKAAEATIAFSQGDFELAQSYALDALKENPRNQQALLVGALSAERLGRINRARQYYEDLIIIDGTETSILGSSSGMPEKISLIAAQRLRAISLQQSKLVIEDKKFNISDDAGQSQSKATITNAWEEKNAKTVPTPKPLDVDEVFTPQEQNIVSRFLVMKELAENDLISKEEFLTRRNANIGGLLPLTKQAPGVGIDRPVPAPELIVERINVLKEGVESRAVTPREFTAEREVIIEALMSPAPRNRLKKKAPSKNILDAATDLRRLEVLYDLNLITSAEKEAEKNAVEKYLGINKAPQPTAKTTNTATNNGVSEVTTTVSEQPIPLNAKVDTVTKGNESVAVITHTEPLVKEELPPQNIVPDVSSPF